MLLSISLIFLVPSFPGGPPSWWSSFLPQEKIHLGLDLQGGMHLILEVQVDKAVESTLTRLAQDIKHRFQEKGIRYISIKPKGTKGITLLLPESSKEKFKTVIKNFPDLKIEKTEAVENGIEVSLSLDHREIERIKRLAADQALETIRNRIDQFGVTEPDIRPQGENRILIQLPGIKDPKRAIAIIGKTALLEFKLVDEEHSVEKALKGDIPPGDEILYEYKIDKKTGRETKIPILVKKRAVLTGEYLTDARVQIDRQYNEPYVGISFDPKGSRLFERITGENVGKKLAIVLDGKVYSAPVIQEKISGGQARITGSFTHEEAHDLAIVLRAGALPAPVKILEERTVGPSLGRDSINKGIKSIIIGGLIVVIFMIVYYKIAGVIADIALIMNLILILACLAIFRATLTLPGIAGLILTIGMAVDGNVIIFERIREEIRIGKTPRAALETGYGKAILTILDAQVTTLIAALVLFQFGTGPIRGFAVTLSIGIITSIFTAIFVTKAIFDLLLTKKKVQKLSI